jgi:uncharacterized caspase-like protein
LLSRVINIAYDHARGWRAAIGGMLTALLALAAWALVAGAATAAENRIALVIGNSQYSKFGLLPNPQMDADAISGALRSVGFDVTLVNNQSLDGMNKALNAFAVRTQAADVAVIYYAGHGIEVYGRNYLIPVDAVLSSDADVRYQAVPLDAVLGAVERSKGLGIVILDACRDNPFLAAMSRAVGGRAIGQGLGKVDPPNGVLVAFSAAEGAVASDGRDGEHSPYAKALMRYIQEPGLEINLLLGKVHDDVLEATGQVQSPRAVSAVGGKPFYFKASTQTASAATGAPAYTALPSGATSLTVDSRYVESQYWGSVAQSSDPEDFRSYLEQYPQGQFAGLARNRIRALSPGAALPVAPPAPAQLAVNDPQVLAGAAPPPQPTQMAALTTPPPPARSAAPPVESLLVRPAMIEFELPTLPTAFCNQVDMNSYLTDLHMALDRAAKSNNQTAIKHFEALKALFNRYIAERPGSPEFMAVSAEMEAYTEEARRQYELAAKVNELDPQIRTRPVGAVANCAKGPWASPIKTAVAAQAQR